MKYNVLVRSRKQRLSNCRMLSIQVDCKIIVNVFCAKQVFTFTNVQLGHNMIIFYKTHASEIGMLGRYCPFMSSQLLLKF